jgi:hypothetical protein
MYTDSERVGIAVTLLGDVQLVPGLNIILLMVLFSPFMQMSRE